MFQELYWKVDINSNTHQIDIKTQRTERKYFWDINNFLSRRQGHFKACDKKIWRIQQEKQENLISASASVSCVLGGRALRWVESSSSDHRQPIVFQRKREPFEKTLFIV